MTLKLMTIAFVMFASISGGASNVKKNCPMSKSVDRFADTSGQDTAKDKTSSSVRSKGH